MNFDAKWFSHHAILLNWTSFYFQIIFLISIHIHIDFHNDSNGITYRNKHVVLPPICQTHIRYSYVTARIINEHWRPHTCNIVQNARIRRNRKLTTQYIGYIHAKVLSRQDASHVKRERAPDFDTHLTLSIFTGIITWPSLSPVNFSLYIHS